MIWTDVSVPQTQKYCGLWTDVFSYKPASNYYLLSFSNTKIEVF